MTLTQAGRIGERRYAVLRKKGSTTGYQCLECGSQTPADPVRFARHECQTSARSKKTSNKAGDK